MNPIYIGTPADQAIPHSAQTGQTVQVLNNGGTGLMVTITFSGPVAIYCKGDQEKGVPFPMSTDDTIDLTPLNGTDHDLTLDIKYSQTTGDAGDMKVVLDVTAGPTEED